ncbi:MAG: hypothetical protein ACI4ED_04020 [Suilimivivens sp.]
MKKGWSAGKIIGVIFGSIAAVIILWIAFVASVFQLVDFMDKIEKNSSDDYEWSYDYEKPDSDRDYDDYGYDDYGYDEYNDYENDRSKERDFFSDGNEVSEEYYDFEDDIKENLTYHAAIESYDRNDFVSENGGRASLHFDYPVISGEIPNVDGINQTIHAEIDSIEEHITSSMEFLSEGDNYEYIGYGYVTYMSEEILSVAYVEYGYLNDSFLESYVVSLNFDMQTGMVLSNTQLVDINDSFSVDFRERCEKQNGEIYELSYMSDQEITAYLTGNDSLIIFYTPLGMEIGFNYYAGWVTVTYKDYNQFMKQF